MSSNEWKRSSVCVASFRVIKIGFDFFARISSSFQCRCSFVAGWTSTWGRSPRRRSTQSRGGPSRFLSKEEKWTFRTDSGFLSQQKRRKMIQSEKKKLWKVEKTISSEQIWNPSYFPEKVKNLSNFFWWLLFLTFLNGMFGLDSLKGHPLWLSSLH